jgi:hypothetical protein
MDLGEKERKKAGGWNPDPILAIATQPKSTQATHIKIMPNPNLQKPTHIKTIRACPH